MEFCALLCQNMYIIIYAAWYHASVFIGGIKNKTDPMILSETTETEASILGDRLWDVDIYFRAEKTPELNCSGVKCC